MLRSSGVIGGGTPWISTCLAPYLRREKRSHRCWLGLIHHLGHHHRRIRPPSNVVCDAASTTLRLFTLREPVLILTLHNPTLLCHLTLLRLVDARAVCLRGSSIPATSLRVLCTVHRAPPRSSLHSSARQVLQRTVRSGNASTTLSFRLDFVLKVESRSLVYARAPSVLATLEDIPRDIRLLRPCPVSTTNSLIGLHSKTPHADHSRSQSLSSSEHQTKAFSPATVKLSRPRLSTREQPRILVRL